MVVLAALAVGIYFIPNWVISARTHHNANAIFVTNLKRATNEGQA